MDVIAGQLELEVSSLTKRKHFGTLYVVEPREEDVIQVTRRTKKESARQIFKDLPVEVPHTIPRSKTGNFGSVGWKQLPDEVYKSPGSASSLHGGKNIMWPCMPEKIIRRLSKQDRPRELLRNSILTPSLGASIMNAKYVNGLPLYPDQPEFLRNDIHISRQVMANWMIQCGPVSGTAL